MALVMTIKFIAGTLEGLEYQYLNKDKFRCANKMFGSPEMFLSDIVSMEIASEENIKRLGGTIGGALVGGILLGGVGAIVGGMGSGQKTETTLIIGFKNGDKCLGVANNSDMVKVLRAHIFNLEQKSGYAEGLANPKPKKKMAMWKKICIGIFLFGLIGAAFDLDKKGTNAQDGNGEVKDPCVNIKTMDDWDNRTSALWRIANPECKPK